MDRSWEARDWLGVRWSAWMPLMAAHPLALAQLPAPAGLYRVRRGDRSAEGWVVGAPAGVRVGVERLSRQVHLPVAPYDDPGSPAVALWLLRREGVELDVSGAALTGPIALPRETGTVIWHSSCAWAEQFTPRTTGIEDSSGKGVAWP